jgi:Mg-chelatase subunit ChlD
MSEMMPGGEKMKVNIDGNLLGIEKRLASIGLPAGPDNVINHKALLGLIFGTLGALIGWILTEPHHENFTFWRDFLILATVGFMICFFIMLTDAVFERNLKAALHAARTSALYTLIIIVPAVLLTKFLFTPTQSVPNPFEKSGNLLKVLVLDVSGSMAGDPLTTLKKAVQAYADLTERKDPSKRTRLACVVFSNDARVVSEPTNDLRSFSDKVSKVSASGGTNMAAGLSLAESIFRRVAIPDRWSAAQKDKPSANEVIMVSDGKPDSVQPVLDSLSFFAAKGIPVHTVGAGSDYDRSLMERIASQTRGTFVPANDISMLVAVMEQFAVQGFTQAGADSGQKLGFASRILGWMLIGVSIGICAALPRKSHRAITWGIIGGLAGGFIGSVLFGVLQSIFSFAGVGSGVVNRFIGFAVLGASVGFSIPLVESVLKPAWIRISEGNQTGRVVIVDKSPMTLGSGWNSDIRISDDPEIDGKHLSLTKVGEDLEIECLSKQNLLVKGVKTGKAKVTHEETFMIGNTEFIYFNQLTGFRAQRSGFEKLNLSGFR